MMQMRTEYGCAIQYGCEGSMELTVQTHSEAETQSLGEQFASCLEPGDIVALVGDLGAGKTAFVKGLARGLGVEQSVTSPTFALVNEYQGRLPVYHFDVYRLDDPSQLEDIGYEEYFFGEGVALIEWANMIPDYLPADIFTVTLAKTGEGERTISFQGDCRRLENMGQTVGEKS